MKFYLGTTNAKWLAESSVPLFISRQNMPRKRMPVANVSWALDSGAFSALKRGAWWIRTRSPYPVTEAEYAVQVRRYVEEIGNVAWVVPFDWPCEPKIVAWHGLGVREHQRRTIESFLRLREELGALVIPVLQGWTTADYLLCIEAYENAGVDLRAEEVVGVGSVCRRKQDTEIGLVLRRLAEEGLGLHAFGVRGNALRAHAEVLVSADSMAWSFRARAAKQGPNAGYERTWNWCCKASAVNGRCSSCLQYALRWRGILLRRLDQLQMSMEATA